VTHPEALGTLVRMLRTAEKPIDGYRYVAQNAKEATRLGTWELDETNSSGGGTKVKDGSAVTMIYRQITEGHEEGEELDVEAEELFCSARKGELSSIPQIWGMKPATIVHSTCIARGGDSCVYQVSWTPPTKRPVAVLAGLGCAIAAGGPVLAVSNVAAGVIAGVLTGALGAVGGMFWERAQREKVARTFEKNRIAALERGLELRGDLGTTPGELTGTVLGGKYRIGRKIGSGGIGVVYAAEHVTLGHEVAVKVLRGAAARDGSEIARLRREAYIQVHIEHPNVVRVLDLDQMPDGSIYVVMERLVGRSLADKLAREGVLTPAFAVPVFMGVCRALDSAHKKDVVHRDLKPGNIFLCDDGTSKVLDFGMGKLTTAESLTQTGYTLGTPEYMAPEQCIGATVEPRTDLYALGVLMYEALTGELPIVAQNRRDLLDLHQRQIPKPMRERRPDLGIPETLDAVVMKCLKKRVGERPKSASELEQMLGSVGIAGLPLTYPSGTGRRPGKALVEPPKLATATKDEVHTLPAFETEPSQPAK
jgi:serine/threonine protein kinase